MLVAEGDNSAVGGSCFWRLCALAEVSLLRVCQEPIMIRRPSSEPPPSAPPSPNNPAPPFTPLESLDGHDRIRIVKSQQAQETLEGINSVSNNKNKKGKRIRTFIPYSYPPPSNSSSSVDNELKAKRKRASPEQLAVLREAFRLNPFPGAFERAHLAKMTAMTDRAVQIWFQNCRQMLKNQQVHKGCK